MTTDPMHPDTVWITNQELRAMVNVFLSEHGIWAAREIHFVGTGNVEVQVSGVLYVLGHEAVTIAG